MIYEPLNRYETNLFNQAVPAADFLSVPGVHEASADGLVVTVQYEGSMAPLLRAATDREVLSVESGSLDLDEMFLEFYRDEVGEDVLADEAEEKAAASHGSK